MVIGHDKKLHRADFYLSAAAFMWHGGVCGAFWARVEGECESVGAGVVFLAHGWWVRVVFLAHAGEGRMVGGRMAGGRESVSALR